MESKEERGPEIPAWLDEGFIARALRPVHADLKESSVRLVSARLLGGGYLSHTFRVMARYSRSVQGLARVTSLVVKSAPMNNGVMRDFMDSGGVFLKEMVAYSSFLPAVDAALSAALGDEWEPTWPRFYHKGSDPTSFLVIEDINAHGFQKIPITDNLDVEHCSAALRALACIHAASVGMIHHQDYADDVFRESLVFNARIMEMYEDTFVDSVEKTMKILDENPWFREYTDKMTRNARTFLRETCAVVSKCEVDFKVIVHGDFHRNNMMFRKDGSNLKVSIYDFQGLHIGSPAEDLQYFLHTSASVEVLRDHTDLLLAEYHGTLQRSLRALGRLQHADAYPLEQLRRDMEHFNMISVHVAFHILPLLVYDEVVDFSKEESMDDLAEKSDAAREKYCRNKRFLRYAEYLTPVFDSKGLLDVHDSH